jgi:hypothetical protein
MNSLLHTFTAREISEFFGVSKSTVKARALAEQWPVAATETCRGGKRVRFALADLPKEFQQCSPGMFTAQVECSRREDDAACKAAGLDLESLLDTFRRATSAAQDAACTRLDAVCEFE